MKFAKESMKKAAMPPAKGEEMLDDSDLFAEAAGEDEAPMQEKAEQEAAPEAPSALADMSDDELLQELKKRGYEIEDEAPEVEAPEEMA